MLNLKEIVERIEQPNLCRVEDSDDLKLISSTYPYSQIFPILYLKSLAINKDIRFEEELTKYAYRISDREQLFNLINSTKETEINITPSNFELEEEKSVVSMQIVQTITSENEISIDPSIEEQTIDEVIEKVEDESEVFALKEISLEEKSEIENPLIYSEEEDEEDQDELFIPLSIKTFTPDSEEKTILKETFIRENEDSEVQTPNSEQAELSTFDKDILSEAISSSYNLDHLADQNEIESIEISEIIFEEEIKNNQEEITNLVHSDKKSFSSWLKSNENDLSPKVDEDKLRIDSLVNKFLIDEPKISRPTKEGVEQIKPKKEFFSPLKNAKASLDDSSMPVSETLAKIFALQGNYPKAIFAYEQLSLINPEKKIFFASRIEELKKKLNT